MNFESSSILPSRFRESWRTSWLPLAQSRILPPPYRNPAAWLKTASSCSVWPWSFWRTTWRATTARVPRTTMCSSCVVTWRRRLLLLYTRCPWTGSSKLRGEQHTAVFNSLLPGGFDSNFKVIENQNLVTHYNLLLVECHRLSLMRNRYASGNGLVPSGN